VALTLLVSLFLFARLAVAELNATLWERRHPVRKTGDPSGAIG
jgi:hypothetical protein